MCPVQTPPELVGAEGFEPPTLCSQSRCATRLRHAPCRSRALWSAGRHPSRSATQRNIVRRFCDKNSCKNRSLRALELIRFWCIGGACCKWVTQGGHNDPSECARSDLSRPAVRARDHRAMRPLVHHLPAELPRSGGHDGRARGIPHDDPSMCRLLRPDRSIAAARAFFRKALAASLPRWPRTAMLSPRLIASIGPQITTSPRVPRRRSCIRNSRSAPAPIVSFEFHATGNEIDGKFIALSMAPEHP
jgi:hypothetical protein